MEQKNNFRQFEEPGPRRRKSRFLAVIFGFCPGAGHMYLGKMNRGLSLMAIFFGDIALGVVFPPVLFLLPLIWFYAFFDCLNLSGLPAAQLERTPDDFGFGLLDQLNLQKFKKNFPAKTGGLLAGWALIIIGVYMLYEMIAYRLIGLLETIIGHDLWWLTSMVGRIPQMLISVLIIWLGIRLIRGSKKNTEEIPQYRAPRRPAPPTAPESSPFSAPDQTKTEPRDTAASVMDFIRSKGLDRKPGELDIMAQAPKAAPEPPKEATAAAPAQSPLMVDAEPSAPAQELNPLTAAPESVPADAAAPVRETVQVELTVETTETADEDDPFKKQVPPLDGQLGGSPDIG